MSFARCRWYRPLDAVVFVAQTSCATPFDRSTTKNSPCKRQSYQLSSFQRNAALRGGAVLKKIFWMHPCRHEWVSSVTSVSMLLDQGVGPSRGVDHGGWEILTPWKYTGEVTACLDPLKCHILSLETVVGQLCKPHTMKHEGFVSKWKAKPNFRGVWNSLMAWPDWPRPLISRQICAVGA